MTRPVSPCSIRRFGGFALAALLGTLGCVDHNEGSKILYVFDGGSKSVLVWNDVSKMAKAGSTAPSADRVIKSSSLLGNMATPLAWGGLAVDTTTDRLYLLTEGGYVYVITKAATQSGDLSAITDITSFNLTASISSGVFGPIAVDTSRNTLYVAENSPDGTSQTHVWTITGASQVTNGISLSGSNQSFSSNGDNLGLGLAVAPGGTLFGLFGNGSNVYSNFTNYSGPRLRQDTSATFSSGSAQVLIGPNTALSSPCKYAALAYDPQNSELYAMPQPGGSTTQAAVLVFGKGQFKLPVEQKPARTLKDSQSALSNLRILSHPIDSDWLLGAGFSPGAGSTFQGTGFSYFYLWSEPSAGASSASQITATGATEVRGLAIGAGSN